MDILRINKYRKELMGLAALWVFYTHFGPDVFRSGEIVWLSNLEWYWDVLGSCGVEIFLFLSGIGLVYSIHKYNVKQFYIRRISRVYLTFFCWFVLQAIVRDDSYTFLDCLKILTFYENWAHNMRHYLWYVSAIMMFYLLFPAYYWVLKKQRHPIVFTTAVLILQICLSSTCYYQIREDLFLVVDRIPIFLIGILIGYLQIEKSDLNLWKTEYNKMQWFFVILTASVLSVVKYQMMRRGYVSWLYNLENIITFTLIILYCILVTKGLELISNVNWGKAFRKILRFFGILSFEIYITHELVSHKVESFQLHLINNDVLNNILIFTIQFVLSIIAACMVFVICDILFRGKWKVLLNWIKQKRLTA